MAPISSLFTPSGSKVTSQQGGATPSLFKANTNTPVNPNAMTTFNTPTAAAPTIQPIKITPDQKKIDVNQIGSNVISAIKKATPLIVKGLSFTVKAIQNPGGAAMDIIKSQQVQKTQQTKVETPKAKPVYNKQTAIDSFKKAFEITPIGAAITTTKKMPGFISGLVGAYSGDPGTFPEVKPIPSKNASGFVAKNKDQAEGAMAYYFLKDLAAFNAGGGGQAFETAGKSALASNFVAPKVAFVQEAVAKFASKEFNALLQNISPTKLTFKDLQDVNGFGGAKATPDQILRYQKVVQMADKLGLRITDLLSPAEKMGVSPKTKVFDFLKNTIESIVKNLKSVLSPEEQKLLGSGLQKDITSIITPGEHTTQEIVGKIINSGLEKTTEGKQIIKMATDAQINGQSIVVDTASNVVSGPVKREIIKLDKASYPGIESGMAVIRPDKTASLDVRFVKEAQGKGQGTKAVQELEQKLVDKGVKTVQIESFPEAVGFWAKQGYKKVGTVTATQNITMSKTLDANAGLYDAYHGTQAKEIRGTPNVTNGKMGEAFYLTSDAKKASAFGKEGNVVNDIVTMASGKKVPQILRQENKYPTSNVFSFDKSGLNIKTVADDAEFFRTIPTHEVKDASATYRLMGYDGVYNKSTGTYAIYNPEKLKIGNQISGGQAGRTTTELAGRGSKQPSVSSNLTTAQDMVGSYQPTQTSGEIAKQIEAQKGMTVPAKSVAQQPMSTPTKQSTQINANGVEKGGGVVSEAQKETQPIIGEGTVKRVNQAEIDNVKTIKDVKNSLTNVKNEFENLSIEVQGKSALAQEKRSGLNTDNIAKLKSIYSVNRKFQEGDIETIRNSKSGPLLNSVIENVQENYSHFSEQEAFDYAMNLPTKAEELVKNTPQMRDLLDRQKILQKYLDQLTAKQKDLLKVQEIKQGDLAYFEWKDAMAAQEKLATILEVPRSQIPVGQGEQKVSQLEARVKKALGDVSQETIDKLGLTTYQEMNNKEMIAKASEYVINNPDEALQVLQGDVKVPKGLNTGAIYVAMVNNSVGNVELATKLATLSSTSMGQNIEILKEIDKNSPVKIMSDIIKVREKAIQRKYAKRSVSEITKKIVAKGEKMIKPPVKMDWSALIKGVAC